MMKTILSNNSNNCSLLFQKTRNNFDYSGNDFINCDLFDESIKNFDNSFFKGCTFENTKFRNATFRHIEFDESNFTNNSLFEFCDFEVSDFIYNYVENTTFKRCNFKNGEWRESQFKNVAFIDCSFDSATISLCKFQNCDFDNKSSYSFHGKSKTFNLFNKTKFILSDISMLENNFGILNQNKLAHNANIDAYKFFFGISILYSSGKLSNKFFIDKAHEILLYFSHSNSRNFQVKIKFISNIIIDMSHNRFSIIQTKYLYSILLNGMQQITNQLLLLEMVKIVTSLSAEINKKISIINNYLETVNNIDKKPITLDFMFDNSYSKEEISSFIKALSIDMGVSDKYITILNYQNGSTILSIVITVSITFGVVLKSLNYFLPELTTTVKNVHELYIETKEFKKTIEIYQEKEAIMKSLEKMNTNDIEIMLTKNNNDYFLNIEGKVSVTIS